MASQVDIANLALALYGEPPITALTEQSKAGRTMNLWFNSSRDAVLRAHPWNFATKRDTLVRIAANPPFGFANAFALPSDYLRTLEMNRREGNTYKIETFEDQLAILTDAGSVNLKYIYRVTNTILFDPLFIQAFASRLASDTALSIVNSLDTADRMWDRYLDKLSEARTIDAQEEPAQLLIVDEFIEARAGTGDGAFRPIEQP